MRKRSSRREDEEIKKQQLKSYENFIQNTLTAQSTANSKRKTGESTKRKFVQAGHPHGGTNNSGTGSHKKNSGTTFTRPSQQILAAVHNYQPYITQRKKVCAILISWIIKFRFRKTEKRKLQMQEMAEALCYREFDISRTGLHVRMSTILLF